MKREMVGTVCAKLSEYRGTKEYRLKHTTEERQTLFNELLDIVYEEDDARQMAKKKFAKAIVEDATQYPGFFTSPASAKYHGAYEGGLFDHCMAVYEAALYISGAMSYDPSEVDFMACVFHDLCKVGAYKLDKNRSSEEKPVWTYADNDGISHGPESLRRLLNSIIELSDQIMLPITVSLKEVIPSKEWQFAIAQHMGAFGMNNEDTINYGKNCEKFQEVLILHTADMIASKTYGV